MADPVFWSWTPWTPCHMWVGLQSVEPAQAIETTCLREGINRIENQESDSGKEVWVESEGFQKTLFGSIWSFLGSLPPEQDRWCPSPSHSEVVCELLIADKVPTYFLLTCLKIEWIQCYHFNIIMLSPSHSWISELSWGGERGLVSQIPVLRLMLTRSPALLCPGTSSEQLLRICAPGIKSHA